MWSSNATAPSPRQRETPPPPRSEPQPSASERRRRRLAAVLETASGDGRAGYALLAPYDAIYVGGSCASVPEALVSQLKVGGRLLLAVGEADAPQDLTLVEKVSASRTRRTVLRGGIMMYGLK